MAGQQIVQRIGWIFKTETVIMPAFFDAVAGADAAATLRGWLPVLNRYGQSLPSWLFASWLKAMPCKKWALTTSCILMGLPFLALTGCWYLPAGPLHPWRPAIFLLLYGLFFAFAGINALVQATLQGKLIRPHRRGRLMAVSTFVGAAGAIFFAWWLMAPWLERPDGGYGLLAAFAGGCFLLTAITSMALYEPADAKLGDSDAPAANAAPPQAGLPGLWRLLRHDANLRRLCLVAVLFCTTIMLFPHYQALARERLGLSGRHLMYWVVVQNAAIGLFGLFIGPLSDARGTRLALRTVIFLTAITPALALLLTGSSRELGQKFFWIVFAPLGMTPIGIRMFHNYTLEISPLAEHPRYISTVNLCLALPICVSPLMGWLIDAAGFTAVFSGGCGLLLLCGVLTFWLDEPRFQPAEDDIVPQTEAA
jgi:hypothetical protein